MADDDSFRQQGNSIDVPTALRSTFTFARRARPPSKKSLDRESRVPLGTAHMPSLVVRKESKGGLRGMFTRNKVGPESNVPSVIEDFVPQGRSRSPRLPNMDETFPESDQPFTRQLTQGASIVPQPQIKLGQPRTPKTPKQNINTTPKPPKQSTETPRRTDAAWDPPPLFQSYPQAIKHALLPASTLSADSIIRLSGQKRRGIANDIPQSGLGPTPDQIAAAKKKEKVKIRHRRQVSDSLSKAEWTQKIYVLVTSGYLLQYASEGSFDRLPEKMMQLGKDSVAFASDVIPGKHWVLQVSQAMDSDGTPAPDTRSLLSRLTFRGADYRRTATSFLLILENAEDMESWLMILRREIEALGGKKHASETGRPKTVNKPEQLSPQTSHRYLVQRDPDRMSNPASPQTLTFKAPWDQSPDRGLQEPTRPIFPAGRAVEIPNERYSIGTSITSDSQHLDSLRDSTHRLSYMSSGERTLVTSRGSSPSWSPVRDTFPGKEDGEPKEVFGETNQIRPNAVAINERRRSVQALQSPSLEAHAAIQTTRPRPHSTFGPPSVAGRNLNHHNHPIPNFSITHIANKRASLSRIPDNISPPHGINTKASTRPKESLITGVRKTTPPTLLPRSLSPVEDQPSPPVIFTPTDSRSLVNEWHENRPKFGEMPPRPSTSPQREPQPVERPNRLSSLTSSNSHGVSDTDVQFMPRRSGDLVHLRSSTELRTSQISTISDTPPSIPLPPSRPSSSARDEEYQRGLAILNQPPLHIAPDTPLPKPPRRPTSMQFISPLSPKSHSSISTPHKETTLSTPVTPRPFPATADLLNAINHNIPSMYSKSTNASPATDQAPTFPDELPTPPLSSTLILSPTHLRSNSPLSHVDSSNSASSHLGNRRSMPHLFVNGPPPAPPPSCALPPLPMGGQRWPRVGPAIGEGGGAALKGVKMSVVA